MQQKVQDIIKYYNVKNVTIIKTFLHLWPVVAGVLTAASAAAASNSSSIPPPGRNVMPVRHNSLRLAILAITHQQTNQPTHYIHVICCVKKPQQNCCIHSNNDEACTLRYRPVFTLYDRSGKGKVSLYGGLSPSCSVSLWVAVK